MGLPLGITPGDIIEVFLLIIAGMGVVWSVRYEVRMMKHDLKNISQKQVALDESLAELNRKMDDQIERIERDLGETVGAMREKVVQVELFMRDNFVRKDTFGPVLSELKMSLQSVGASIENRILRLEGRLDTQMKGKP